MRRYESKEKKRFWEIDASENGLRIRTGEIGKNGRESFKEMGLEEAQRLAEKRVADKLKLGWRLVGSDEHVEAREPGLEDTIAADPNNPAGYQIYADWLQEQGELRGQLIALDVEPTSDAKGKKIAKARRDFLNKHPAYDLPPRFGEFARKKRKKNQVDGTVCEVVWRHGFIAEAEVGLPPGTPYELIELIRDLLGHPSARFLQSLIVGSLGDPSQGDYTDIADEIARLAPKSLRRLVLAEFGDADIGEIALSNADKLIADLPHLHSLTLRANQLGIAKLEHEGLKELTLEATAFDPKLWHSLGTGLPALERLSLRGAETPVPPSALGPLLAEPPKRLTSLAITSTADTEPLAIALFNSPLAAQLTELDFSFGSISDTNLLSEANIGHLAKLDVSANFMPDDFEETLAPRVAELAFKPQRENLPGYHTVTEAQAVRYALDTKSVTAARKVAKPASWIRLGREPTRLWGECRGSEDYEVFVDIEGSPSGAACTCPSRKYPCKHALGLLLLMASGHRFPIEEAPESLIDNAEYSRYDTAWE